MVNKRSIKQIRRGLPPVSSESSEQLEISSELKSISDILHSQVEISKETSNNILTLVNVLSPSKEEEFEEQIEVETERKEEDKKHKTIVSLLKDMGSGIKSLLTLNMLMKGAFVAAIGVGFAELALRFGKELDGLSKVFQGKKTLKEQELSLGSNTQSWTETIESMSTKKESEVWGKFVKEFESNPRKFDLEKFVEREKLSDTEKVLFNRRLGIYQIDKLKENSINKLNIYNSHEEMERDLQLYGKLTTRGELSDKLNKQRQSVFSKIHKDKVTVTENEIEIERINKQLEDKSISETTKNTLTQKRETLFSENEKIQKEIENRQHPTFQFLPENKFNEKLEELQKSKEEHEAATSSNIISQTKNEYNVANNTTNISSSNEIRDMDRMIIQLSQRINFA